MNDKNKQGRKLMTKGDIVNSIKDQFGFSRDQTVETVETLLEIMKQTLESGEDILVSGFGKFCIKEKAERRGRNPATGADLMLAPRRVVTFKCSGKLRERVNSND